MLCNPSGNDWYASQAKENFSCYTSCQGVYADVNYNNETMTEEKVNLMEQVTRMYINFKKDFTQNYQFDRENKFGDPIYNHHGRLLIHALE